MPRIVPVLKTPNGGCLYFCSEQCRRLADSYQVVQPAAEGEASDYAFQTQCFQCERLLDPDEPILERFTVEELISELDTRIECDLDDGDDSSLNAIFQFTESIKKRLRQPVVVITSDILD